MVSYSRTISDFTSDKETCRGWFYRPDKIVSPGVIIMAHGFAAESSFKLPEFAERFASNGWGVYLFDYRSFGESSGMPRQNVNPFTQLRDWQAAIEHVKCFERIDTDNIILLGTSFSGGHVMSLAAKRSDIRAIIAQVPFVSGLSSMFMMPIGWILKAGVLGLRDVLSSIFLNRTYSVKVYGSPKDDFAIMQTPESLNGYESLIPNGSQWINQVPAKILLMIPFYIPAITPRKIDCPALIIAAQHDSLVPVEAVIKTADKIKKSQLEIIDCNHFQPYHEKFEHVISKEIEFLDKVSI